MRYRKPFSEMGGCVIYVATSYIDDPNISCLLEICGENSCYLTSCFENSPACGVRYAWYFLGGVAEQSISVAVEVSLWFLWRPTDSK